MSWHLAGGILVCAAISISCTLNNQEAPPLAGPSEFSTSISVAALPDVLPADGKSEALVTITARDAYGSPLRNLSLRVAVLMNGSAVDLGVVSARSLVTDASGRATLVYTAPAIHVRVDSGTKVDIGVTPLGTNFANAVARTATIHLVAPLVPLR